MVNLMHEDLTKQILAAAFDVHSELGPGLLESVYETCMAHELARRGVLFRRQAELPVKYRGVVLDAGFRLDLDVAEAVVVELKAVEKLLPVHESQLFTYLRLSGRRIGLLLNFNVQHMKDGIVRRIL